MRHRKAVKKLGRTAPHRKAMLANMAASLFQWKHITTTEAKAKAARQYSEKLITLAKKDTTHARRIAFSQLRQKKIVKLLFDEIGPHFHNRSGGYTRVIKIGQRSGDGAHMAVLELVGFDTASKKKKEKDKEKEAKTESRKRKKGKGEKEEVAKAEESVKKGARKKSDKKESSGTESTKSAKEGETKKSKKKDAASEKSKDDASGKKAGKAKSDSQKPGDDKK
jgi:large subunit ribosomal protein L17